VANFCRIEDSAVVEIIVISDDDAPTEEAGQHFIADHLGKSGLWLQTSYNSHGGKHYVRDYQELSGRPHFRFNFGDIGFSYDADRDAFISPKPSPEAVLDETTCLWVLDEEPETD
jgi:hypothetical protein